MELRTQGLYREETTKAEMPKGYEGRGIVSRTSLEHPEKFITCTNVHDVQNEKSTSEYVLYIARYMGLISP